MTTGSRRIKPTTPRATYVRHITSTLKHEPAVLAKLDVTARFGTFKVGSDLAQQRDEAAFVVVKRRPVDPGRALR